MKLCNIRSIGRYINNNTKKEYNVKTGYRKQRGTSHKFYLYRGKRVFINDMDFYHNHTKVII